LFYSKFTEIDHSASIFLNIPKFPTGSNIGVFSQTIGFKKSQYSKTPQVSLTRIRKLIAKMEKAQKKAQTNVKT
jgi:hypothetical protein